MEANKLISTQQEPERAERLKLHEVLHAAGEPTVTVILTLGSQRILGIGRRATGEAAPVEWLAAEATAAAISRLIAPRASLALEHVECVQMRQAAICLVQLAVNAGTPAEPVFGASLVRDDRAAAGARAVLAAINRRLPQLLRERA